MTITIEWTTCCVCGKECVKSATTATAPDGHTCFDCRLKDRPCKPAKAMPAGFLSRELWAAMPDGSDWHSQFCPESQWFDRRKTKQNWPACTMAAVRPFRNGAGVDR